MCHMFLYCKLLLDNLGFVSVSYLIEIAEDDSTLIGVDIKVSSNDYQAEAIIKIF